MRIANEAVILSADDAKGFVDWLQHFGSPTSTPRPVSPTVFATQQRTDRLVDLSVGDGSFSKDHQPWVRIRIVDPASANAQALAAVDLTLDRAREIATYLSQRGQSGPGREVA